MTQRQIEITLKLLSKASRQWRKPVVSGVAQLRLDPFRVLISTLLSLRTRDPVTELASVRLFKVANNPQSMLELSETQIAELIYPVAFYRTKARQVLGICAILMEKYVGRVPSDMDALTSFPGVGRKTANLVLIVGFGLPAMCVDTHVHRISNRWGYIRTDTPNQSEMVLRKKLPRRHWMKYNDLLVSFGQNQCKPISPLCSTCPVIDHCPQIGVRKSR